MFKLLHVLLLVYWLGADIGTFYASRFVADARLTPAARAVAARIMLGVDLLPRLAMPLTLATGAQLAAGMGLLPGGGAAVAAVWVLCLSWLEMVLLIHHRTPQGRAAGLVRFDFWFRVVLAAALAAAGLSAWLASMPPWPAWLAIKLLAFAATVVCGLAIRIRLRPFGPAFARLMSAGPEGVTAADNQVIASSLARCKPYVIVIWVLLVVCAAAGLHLIG